MSLAPAPVLEGNWWVSSLLGGYLVQGSPVHRLCSHHRYSGSCASQLLPHTAAGALHPVSLLPSLPPQYIFHACRRVALLLENVRELSSTFQGISELLSWVQEAICFLAPTPSLSNLCCSPLSIFCPGCTGLTDAACFHFAELLWEGHKVIHTQTPSF